MSSPTTQRCPICDAAFDPRTTPAPPFCSRRCQSVDLRRWLDEEYSVPRVGRDEDEEDEQ